ncbi:centrosomal protein of 131 kDa isoform X2 [Harpegnathos saltator]|uniref:centrosomal protein of 131 kDa isoform X2 n=1 Tax=Harpegnathos saltator TaxID=610380 RepID=UPI000948CA16|nr:centrosomal protein of 131 kDa isoform X2 [Harpegnathos saltator]
MQIEPERDVNGEKCTSLVTTYDDIMSFLGTLENEGVQVNDNIIADGAATIISSCRGPSRYETGNGLTASSCRRDDLETARLQIEEKNATIECLKDQLKSERETACDKINTQRQCYDTKTKELKSNYRTMVERHQRFIEQLIAEKTDLTQKCDSLVRQMKEMEQKIQRNVKVINERHAVELQRMRENAAAAEKIRRERWLEMKTSKIKEMTVKGLEPELHSMMEQHQREIQELRRAHIKELQDMELRTLRRSNQQLEQLRIELTDNHEKLLTKEKDMLTARYEEKLEKQEAHFRMLQSTFAERFEKDRLNLLAEQKKRDQETSMMMQQTQLRFQEKTETLREQHEIAKKNFEESLREEWLAWADDYKRQQSASFTRAETMIRNDCQRERDKQIEIAISRLEKESRDMRAKLQQNFDDKLQLTKEEYDARLQAAIKSESIYKNKLSLLEKRSTSAEVQLEKIENKFKECMSNLHNMNQTIAKLTVERDNAKEIARKEIEIDKRELENKIASLHQEIARNNANRDQLMMQLHSRVKLVFTQKILIIKDLNKKLNDAVSKCEYLEKLLDQQRKEYILKSL